jgi:ABC-type branched-subunit amino acid transport system substrate-binding protein
VKARVLVGLGMIALVVSALLAVTKAHSQEEPYKIGAVFSVTGGGSFLGDPEKKTAEMIAEEINRQGVSMAIPLNCSSATTRPMPPSAICQ